MWIWMLAPYVVCDPLMAFPPDAAETANVMQWPQR
jgi:hypothetical protein